MMLRDANVHVDKSAFIIFYPRKANMSRVVKKSAFIFVSFFLLEQPAIYALKNAN